jgi:transcriptional regulator with XRE-family HTH domain
MINSKLIKDRMAEKKISQKDIAEALRVAKPTVSQKINNVRPLSLEEANVLRQLLDIPDDQFSEYFFANEIA